MNLRHVSLALVLALGAASFVSHPAHAQGSGQTITRGQTDKGIYRNDYFGIRLNVPEGWVVLTDDELQRFSAPEIGGAIRAVRAGTPLSEMAGFPLVMLANPKLSLEAGGMVSVILSVASFGSDQSPLRMATVIEGLRANAQAASPGRRILIEQADLNGKNFRWIEVTRPLAGRNMTQRFYMTEVRDYALGIISTVLNPTHQLAVQELLDRLAVSDARAVAARRD